MSPERAKPVRDLIVVFGDQLTHDSPLLRDADPARDAVLMIEAREESTHVPSHIQRTVLFLSAMRHFAGELAEQGRRVVYCPIDSPDNTGSFAGELRRVVERFAPERVRCTLPGEWRVLEAAESWRDDPGVELDIAEDPHFLTTREQFAEWAAGRKSLVMEHFYHEQRRRLGVLVDAEGNPEGGHWNYDEDNRRAFGRSGPPPIPPPTAFEPDRITRAVIETVQRIAPDLPGSIDSFAWPVNRAQAVEALRDFIEHRLESFGPFEDAMWQGEPVLFHSRLSPALNLKLLSPRECVAAALRAHRQGRAPIQSVEGFVRQIIGWREFTRGVYWHEGPGYADRNALEEHGRLPELYWTGRTEMNCLRRCVGEVLDNAYGHHIQRLMVTGNFALLAGVHPREISDWYLGMYADAVDWVTLPNTLGMVMHADGGAVGTKPYAAGGRYIDRMSNYCKGCRFDPGARTGDDACPFTVLFWDFLARHRHRLASNPRMKLMFRNLDRVEDAELAKIRSRARQVRVELGITAPGRSR